MIHYNVFRILADVSHVISTGILIRAIVSNKSAEGVSLISQCLYVLVFLCRYTDLFWAPPSFSYWNFVLKLFFISSSILTVVLMMKVYARTREREKAWKLGAYTLAGSLLAAPFICLIFEGKAEFRFFEIIYVFSLILESVCILPQLLLLRQTSVPTVIDSYYLVTLGSYRFFYILNWIVRGFTEDRLDPIYPVMVAFGVVQTALYLDFAWVYWSRQRVKLRGGGVVDGEDLRKGWLVSRLIGRRSLDDQDGLDGLEEERDGLARQEEGNAPQQGKSWGPRGISVSADEGLQEAEYSGNGHVVGPDLGLDLADPDAFEDELDDEGTVPVVNSAGEWRDED